MAESGKWSRVQRFPPLGYKWMQRSWTEWKICATCRGGHFHLAQKILRYNPFTLHCFCCSALYSAPIPLSFHLPYCPPLLQPPNPPSHHTLKLQQSWSLSIVSQANTSAGKSLFVKGDEAEGHMHRLAQNHSRSGHVTFIWTSRLFPKQ